MCPSHALMALCTNQKCTGAICRSPRKLKLQENESPNWMEGEERVREGSLLYSGIISYESRA